MDRMSDRVKAASEPTRDAAGASSEDWCSNIVGSFPSALGPGQDVGPWRGHGRTIRLG